MTACPPIEDLLVAAERETLDVAFVRHLDECAECRDALDVLGAGEATLEEAWEPLAMRYRLLGVKAQGGQGVICHARDVLLDREVAVKLISIEDESSDALLDEARRLAMFSHPRVVRVYDAGVDAGHVFVVMELIDGVSADLLALTPTFSRRDAVRIALQASEGLDAMHRAGLVHGDISPRNIVVGRDGEVVLVDLGLSGSGKVAGGTRGFVAPEVVRTQRRSSLSDQYALGRVLELLLSSVSAQAQGALLVARRASDPQPARRFHSLAAMRWRLRTAYVRRWLVAGALGLLCLAVSGTADSPANLMSQIEAAAIERAGSGADQEIATLVAQAEDLAVRSDERTLMLRSHLLSAKFPESDAHGRDSVAQALLLAEFLGDDEARADALALASLYAQSPDDRLFLADYSTRVDPQGLLSSFSLALAGGKPKEPTETDTDLARTLAVIRALSTIGDPNVPAEPLDCAFLEEPVERGVCLAIDASALADKEPSLAIARAELALDLLKDEGGRSEHCTAYDARGIARLENNATAALKDLETAAACCTDCSDLEVASNAAAQAYALVRLNRLEDAAALLPRIEPREKSLQPTPRRFLERTRAALWAEARTTTE
ncbi:MAG: serine/threonine protein kinase [Nannocystaceae bacterium]|nr:serine/threonine protein kinase [Nannocystaceae bacterium]